MLYPDLSKKKLGFTVFVLIFVIIATIRFVSACTIFTSSYGDTVLFGNNEDWTNPNTYIWFELSENNQYGGVYLGFNDFHSQGGMNEKGLCFDANGLPRISLNSHPELPYTEEWVVRFLMKICTNVTEVTEMASKYNWGTSIAYQVQFVDATGDAVVISAGINGELNFTRKIEGEGYLVSTNFNLANPDNGWSPCWRYNKATEMLDAIDHEDDLTVEYFRDILKAVHQEGTYATKYSNIFDLKNRDIYIYKNFNFNGVVVLNLDEELAKGDTGYTTLDDLFVQELQTTTTTETTPLMPILFLCVTVVGISIIRKKK
ncbi:MAG: carcinine hydrolase/isopenicillin-N N-acyltransferase family protein [Candidatus Hodarchaeota archaeon]